jgi:long-subunit acyl-CoA synthetase (AMP-forming)
MVPRSLPELVDTWARIMGPKPAFSTAFDGGVDISWIDLRNAAWTLAKSLLDSGFPPGGCVATLVADGPAAVVAEAGVHAAEGVALPLGAHEAVGELASAIRDARCCTVLCDPGLEALAREARSVAGPGARHADVRVLEPVTPGTPTPEGDPARWLRLDRLGPETDAIVARSSGRTGPRKLVAWNQRNLIATGAAVAVALGAGESDTWATLGPLVHPFLRTVGLYAPLVSCGRIVAPGPPDPLQALWLGRPTIACTLADRLPGLRDRVVAEVGTMEGLAGRLARWSLAPALGDAGRGTRLRAAAARAVAVLAGPSIAAEVVGGRLRCLVGGWGRVDDPTAAVFGALGVQVCGSWGLAESAGVTTLDRPLAGGGCDRDRPLDGVSVRVEEGELRVAGPNVMFSYHGISPPMNPALAGGWLRTDDRGRVEADGRVRVDTRGDRPRE